jgi:hypothetical protein
MPTLVLNPLPLTFADLPGTAHGGEFVRLGFIIIKESL